MAAIHRQVVTIAEEQGWKPPSYDRVRQIIKNIDPALVTLAYEGAAVYREEFDLLHRREATHSNAIWQADHSPLGILLLNGVTLVNGVNHTLSYECASQEVSLEGM
jgi:putative transposase